MDWHKEAHWMLERTHNSVHHRSSLPTQILVAEGLSLLLSLSLSVLSQLSLLLSFLFRFCLLEMFVHCSIRVVRVSADDAGMKEEEEEQSEQCG